MLPYYTGESWILRYAFYSNAGTDINKPEHPDFHFQSKA